MERKCELLQNIEQIGRDKWTNGQMDKWTKIRIMIVVILIFGSFGFSGISIAEEKTTEPLDLDQSELKIDLLDELEFPSITENYPMEEKEVIQEEESIVNEESEEKLETFEETVEDTVIVSDHSDLTIISSGAFWILGDSKENNDTVLRMFGDIPDKKPSAWNDYFWKNFLKQTNRIEIKNATLIGNFFRYFGGSYFPEVESVIIEQSDLSGVTSFESAFERSSEAPLKECLIRNNDYSEPSLTTIKRMFYGCAQLEKVDLSGLDTGRVTNMDELFMWGMNLTELELGYFDTSSVVTMFRMFGYLVKIPYLDVSGFDVGKVENMSRMFEACESIETLDLRNFTSNSLKNIEGMFAECKNLRILNIDELDTRLISEAPNLFRRCENLLYLSVSKNFNYLNELLFFEIWMDEKHANVYFSSISMNNFHIEKNEDNVYRRGYVLSMNAMGGQFDDLSTEKKQYQMNGDQWSELIPKKQGFILEGWYTDLSFTELFDFSKPASISTTIYAKWVEIYTVIIPASITINDSSELKIEGLNRGNKTLSIGIDREETSISEDSNLTLVNSANSSIKCLAAMSWNGSENNPNADILTVLPSSEITEGEGQLSIRAPSGDTQAGKYIGNIVFSVKYE